LDYCGLALRPISRRQRREFSFEVRFDVLLTCLHHVHPDVLSQAVLVEKLRDSAVLRSVPISCANCCRWVTVISAVTFSRQHFFFRSLISASRTEWICLHSRNNLVMLTAPMLFVTGLCDASHNTQ
jgi:hypothetical protein